MEEIYSMSEKQVITSRDSLACEELNTSDSLSVSDDSHTSGVSHFIGTTKNHLHEAFDVRL